MPAPIYQAAWNRCRPPRPGSAGPVRLRSSFVKVVNQGLLFWSTPRNSAGACNGPISISGCPFSVGTLSPLNLTLQALAELLKPAMKSASCRRLAKRSSGLAVNAMAGRLVAEPCGIFEFPKKANHRANLTEYLPKELTFRGMRGLARSRFMLRFSSQPGACSKWKANI